MDNGHWVMTQRHFEIIYYYMYIFLFLLFFVFPLPPLCRSHFGMVHGICQLGLTLALLLSFKSKSQIFFIIIISVCLQFQTSNTLFITNYERWQWWRRWRWLVAICIELFIIKFFFLAHFSYYYTFIAKRGRKMNYTGNLNTMYFYCELCIFSKLLQINMNLLFIMMRRFNRAANCELRIWDEQLIEKLSVYLFIRV